MVTLYGLLFTSTVVDELLEAILEVQFSAAVVSWHFIDAPFQPCGIKNVVVVFPLMAFVPLYHCHVRADVFSESPSASENVPLLQVSVCPVWGIPVIVGWVSIALLCCG